MRGDVRHFGWLRLAPFWCGNTWCRLPALKPSAATLRRPGLPRAALSLAFNHCGDQTCPCKALSLVSMRSETAVCPPFLLTWAAARLHPGLAALLLRAATRHYGFVWAWPQQPTRPWPAPAVRRKPLIRAPATKPVPCPEGLRR